jgi:A/G-specific adenine glycosylase
MPRRGRQSEPPDASAARIVEPLVAWFANAKRDLPWRDLPAGRRDPYRTLVSEAMLQQTQVSRVVEKFRAFIERFPTVDALAAADERDVMTQWAGLGYYRRARNLHAAARHVVERCGRTFPSDVEGLLELPGVGRYTAGAIASLALGRPAPIVDGNVARVMLRVQGRDLDPQAPATTAWAWEQAATFASAAGERAGEANEALMELGATVCTPGANPSCGACPLSERCEARRLGVQDRIPKPKKAKAPTKWWMAVLVIRDDQGRLLCERRGPEGLWAGLRQPVTLEAQGAGEVEQAWLAEPTGACRGVRFAKVAAIKRQLTHRSLTVEVHEATVTAATATRLTRAAIGPAIGLAGGQGTGLERRWMTPEALAGAGLSRAHEAALAAAGVVFGPG